MLAKYSVAALAAAGIVTPVSVSAQSDSRTSYRIEHRIAGPDGGWDFANVDPADGRLYVARSNAVMAVDLKTNIVTPTLATAHRGHQVLPLPGGRELVETDGDTGLTRFIGQHDGKVIAQVATGKNPDAAFYDAATGLLAVMNAGDGTLALVDPVNHRLAGRFPIEGGLEFGVAEGHGRAFINLEDANAIAVVDLKARRLVRRIELTGCKGPTGLALVAGGKRLISACANETAVVVDPLAGKVVGRFAIGRDPDAVLVDEKRQLAFIPCGGSGTLVAVDISDADHLHPIGTITTQVGAKTGAVDPRTGRIYLPTATLAPPEPGAKRGKPIHGSFVVLVLTPSQS